MNLLQQILKQSAELFSNGQTRFAILSQICRAKKIWFLGSLLLIETFSQAQNLVPNPSFENYITCPDNIDQLWKLQDWFNPNNSTPDYYNACDVSNLCGYPCAGVPKNFGGFQFAHTGDGYAAIIFNQPGYPSYREYLEAKLIEPLVANVKYQVEFYVNLDNYAAYATDAMGAYFSVDSIGCNCYYLSQSVISQINNPTGNFVLDTLNWVKISGSFIATGGEKFITIGNFKDTLQMDTLSVPWPHFGFYPEDYYMIDDVSVEVDSKDDDISDVVDQKNIFVLSSSVSNNFALSSSNSIETVRIFNATGQTAYTYSSLSGEMNLVINLSSVPAGFYFLVVKTKNDLFSKKLFVHP